MTEMFGVAFIGFLDILDSDARSQNKDNKMEMRPAYGQAAAAIGISSNKLCGLSVVGRGLQG